MKWLFLAVICTVFAIVIMLIGVFRNNKMAKAYAETEEQKQENIKKGQSIFLKHTVVSVILIAVAIIIRVATGGSVA
jgi:Na+/H+ antiporter NhaD/arsenite permease-like protein